SLSVRCGVQETITREYSRYGELRKIKVHPLRSSKAPPSESLKVEGQMSKARRERLQKELHRDWQWRHRPEGGALLTKERLRELALLDHVRSVQPVIQLYGRAILGDQMEYINLLAATPDDEHFRKCLVAGASFSSTDAPEVLVTEFCLYRLGVVDE